jgi:long-chain acyl-CoA synthetase
MDVVKQFSTLTEMFDIVTSTYANVDRPALMHKVQGKYQGISYSELRRKVELFALGLASLGVKRNDKIGIIAENRPEWVIADIAILSLGAVDVPLFPSLTAKQVEFCFKDAGVRLAIISNQLQLSKVLKVFGEIKSLEKVVLMNPLETRDSKTVQFASIYELGERFEKENADYLKDSLKQVKPSDLATIIYTSGTTGNPKGVMLTHNNFVSNILGGTAIMPIYSTDLVLSFLPLCHSFERTGGYYACFSCGATIAYAESIDTVAENMLELRPTFMTTVPRLFERMYARVKKSVESSPPAQRKIFDWAVSVGRKHAKAAKSGHVPINLRMQHRLADRLVYHKLRERTGGRFRYIVSGGAALSRELGEFFEAVGIMIIEGYGLTETSPIISGNRLDDFKFGTVGKPIPGVEVKIAEDGEILTRGPHVMKGYYNNRKATEETIDKDGWLHTGDIGVIDAAGFITITDRKKHLFVSSGGKNIAPQPIERMFLNSKYIDQFVLIGDRRQFLSALIVPDFDAIKEFADSRDIKYSTVLDLTKNDEIYKLIEKDIQVLQRDLANYERVRRFVLLHKPLSIEEGEITPTLKVRRQAVEDRYAELIESMYKSTGRQSE